MELQYVKQDITTVTEGVVAHGCNTNGVMGAGVARFLRNKHPVIYPGYAKICVEAWNNGVEDTLLGKVNYVMITEKPLLIVANCFTQHLGKLINGNVADPASIEASVGEAMAFASQNKLPFYMPKIGAGLGGLDWDTDVEPIIQRISTYHKELPIYICVWP